MRVGAVPDAIITGSMVAARTAAARTAAIANKRTSERGNYYHYHLQLSNYPPALFLELLGIRINVSTFWLCRYTSIKLCTENT